MPPMPSSRARLSLLLAVVLGSLGAGAFATTYRWVDDQGRVHYSDAVPNKYKERARLVDLQPSEPSEEDRRRALEQLERAREKARAADRSAKPASAASAPKPERSPVTNKKRPDRVPTDDTDCQTWQRLYEESMECFGPYRTATGGIKPEAFKRCTEFPELPSRCRPQLR